MHKITDRMIVKAGVLAVLLCLAFGICFKYRYKLKEPVFLEQNTVVTAVFNESGEQAGWYAEIMLYYITGKEDDRLVQYIEFPELEQRNSAGENPAVRTEFAETAEVEGQYVLHALGGTLFIPSEALEREAEVTKGRVVYTDGSSREVSLGSILFEQRTGEETAAENASAHFQ